MHASRRTSIATSRQGPLSIASHPNQLRSYGLRAGAGLSSLSTGANALCMKHMPESYNNSRPALGVQPGVRVSESCDPLIDSHLRIGVRWFGAFLFA